MARSVKVKVGNSSVKSYLALLIDRFGYNDEIETFDLCSMYSIDLEGSTIDKIVKSGDTYLFYYNENTSDYDTLECFNQANVLFFAMDIKKALIKEEEIAYAENYGEGAVARLG